MAHILLIDDDEQLLQLMAITLRKAGHEITAVQNGAAGLVLLGEQEFSLVVTDIVMPEKDGIEVIMAIERMHNKPLVLAISGGSQRLNAGNLLKTAKMLAVDMVLPKPISPAGLCEAVETLLLSRQA